MKLCQTGENGEYTFYAIVGVEYAPEGFDDAHLEEYKNLLNMSNDIIYSAIYGPPVPSDTGSSETIDIDTEDLYGNPVNTAELFSEHEITMVNMWATWCPHCCEELPTLEVINNRLQDIDCGIVGILTDSDVDAAREIISDSGVTYPIIKATEICFDIFECTGLPTSYFVNRNGKIVGSPIVGTETDKFEDAVRSLRDEALNAATTPFDTRFEVNPDQIKQDNNLASNADDYRVICVDENGEPVPGAKVQFCSNDLCMMGTTDENGIAVFDADPGPNNVVHLLKPPEGYAKDDTAYQAHSFYGDVTITLQTA